MNRTLRRLLLAGAGVLAVLVAVVTGAASRVDAEEVPEPVVDRAVGAVGLVRSAGVFGSGWVARSDTVITNLHVAKGGTGDIYMDFSDGERIECYTAVGDRDMDLAVLRCETGERSGLGVPIEALVPLLDTAESYPATKAGAEWRLRIRRSVITALLVGPIAWFLARRSGRNGPVGIAARWSTGAIVATLLLTQAQFAMSGPAHFL